jgi:FAD/FMN-containing dehydrogenase
MTSGGFRLQPEEITRLRLALERQIEGEVRFDEVSRALYSTDASVYQIAPLGVVVPRTRDDLVRIVRLCAEFRCPLTMRGGGTSQAGQAIGPGLVVDTSKYLNRIIHLDVAARRVRVEPGIVLDTLNRELLPHRLRFAPDISTASRATVGGMMANNSSGARSVLYGKTIDHVLEQEVVLSDGSLAQLRPLSAAALDAACAGESLEAACYRAVRRLAAEHAVEIERRYPRVLRRVGGYNLDEFIKPDAPFNLARMMVGSEGTLGVVLEATLNLVPLPNAKAVMAIQFAQVLESLAATPVILQHGPSAIEVMDGFILSFTRQNAALDAMRRSFIDGDPGALLCVEMYADRPEDLPPRLEALERDLRARGLGYRYHHLLDAASQAKVWTLREAALGLSMAMKGDAKSLSFVEDTAVAPEKLRDYIERFIGIVERHGSTTGLYAHASVGCLHVRPVVNMKTVAGIATFEAIANDVSRAQLVHVQDVRRGDLRGVPRDQADVRPARHLQPRQDRRRPAADGEPALRRRVPDAVAGDLVRLPRLRRHGRRCRDVQRSWRLPQGARRDDVPVVHGDAGREALDAGPSEYAAAGDGRPPGRSGARRPGRL